MTLEELQEKYIELQNEHKQLKDEKNSLLTNIEELKNSHSEILTTKERDMETLRNANMKLFLQVQDTFKESTINETEEQQETVKPLSDILKEL